MITSDEDRHIYIFIHCIDKLNNYLGLDFQDDGFVFDLLDYIDIPQVKEFLNILPMDIKQESFKSFYDKTGFTLGHVFNHPESETTFDMYGSYSNIDRQKTFIPTGKHGSANEWPPTDSDEILIFEDVVSIKQNKELSFEIKRYVDVNKRFPML